MAATFNPQLVEKGSQISAYETRASNIPWTFNPTMDLGRDARWSRQWESYGEDAYLNATMAVASVRDFREKTETVSVKIGLQPASSITWFTVFPFQGRTVLRR
jgi:beta-glucosidase-like glycosyl hydrolase